MQNDEPENSERSNYNGEHLQNGNSTNSCKDVVAFVNIFKIANEYYEQQQQQQPQPQQQHQQQPQQQHQQQQNEPNFQITRSEEEQRNNVNFNDKRTVTKSSTKIEMEEHTLRKTRMINASKLFQHNSMGSVLSAVCRICQIPGNEERLISPCLCKGSLAYVHKHCLERWLSVSGMVQCELCHYQFKTRQKLRYSFAQSVRLWFRHPNNFGLLQADFLVCSLLSVVSIGLVGIAMLGLHYFSSQGDRLGVSRIWSQFIILAFLCIIIAVYIVNVFVIVKSQIAPWYRWWRSAKIITLVLENRKIDKGKYQNNLERELQTTVLSRPSCSSNNYNGLPPQMQTTSVSRSAIQ